MAETTLIEYLAGNLRGLQELPRQVYHYTSPSGLLGILGEKALWATDVRYLNDSQEFLYTRELAQNLLELERTACTHDIEKQLLDELLRAVEIAPHVRLYASSLAFDGDQLSQWRAYCPPTGGFSVGFDSLDLMLNTGCFLIPCVYDPPKQQELVVEALGFVYERFRSRPAESEAELVLRIIAAGVDFLGGLLLLAASFKDSSFSEEREWRLLSRGGTDTAKPLLHREGRSGIVPYVALTLSRSDVSDPLFKVVVGPNLHPELAADAVQSLLNECARGKVVLEVSQSPFRGW